MINSKQFFSAISELSQQKGISQESIFDGLREAFRRAIIKKLGGGDDAHVEVIIDEEKALIEMYHLKKVVESVEDDYLEIELKEAQKLEPKIQVGDNFKIPFDLSDANKIFANTVKSVLHQKINEAEKQALYETYKDKTGEMITGIVEKYDERSVIVNIGRTTVYLSPRELIGEESFETGQQIRLYVAEVSSLEKTEKGFKGEKSQGISVTRAHPGFIKRLFEEEVHEIYDGTVMIKLIVREAGLRSKVAVYSDDPNVDPTGACIGHDGTRIKKILGQLGNAREKEKIDVIQYISDDALFIVEALRPATVIGVHLNKEEKTALAVVQNEQLSLAIGRKGANARLANKISGYEIDIKEESVAQEYNLEYTPVAILEEEAKERLIKERYQRYIGTLTPASKKEEEPVEVQEVSEQLSDEVKDLVIEEEKVQEVVKEKEEVQIVNVKVTTDLFELERQLEKEKAKDKVSKPRTKRPPKISEEDVSDEYKEEVVKPVVQTPKMEIYSEEELASFESEEKESDDSYYDDIDYDEFDEYYDDED